MPSVVNEPDEMAAPSLGALIGALRILKQKGAALRSLFIGDCARDEKLRREAVESGVNISFIDNVPNSSLPMHLGRARNFILPSFYEGHPKVLIEANDNSAIANLVGSEVDVELSVASHTKTLTATVVVNARVVCAPEVLDEIVVAALSDVSQSFIATVEVRDMQRFRPGRPVPTHRVTNSQ